MKAENLFEAIPAELPEELVTTLHTAGAVRIERIVSQGQASPPGFWYDQPTGEWVLLVEGSAAVQFEGQPEPVQLRRGSYLYIPAHARHRVAWTASSQQTVWLAIHFETY